MVPPCSDRISRVPPYSNPFYHNTCTGLSPTKAQLSRRFQLVQKRHWPDPRSLATTSGVSVDVLSSRYLDVSVPWVCFTNLCIQLVMTLRPGFPIRKFSDQSLLTAPQDLSQRATSFIASARQGIHRMLLRRLITLIIAACRPPEPKLKRCGRDNNKERPDNLWINPIRSWVTTGQDRLCKQLSVTPAVPVIIR